MNSDEERTLFEEHGWTQDLIGRRWTAPVLYRGREIIVTYDELVAYSTTPKGEKQLRQIIETFGKSALDNAYYEKA